MAENKALAGSEDNSCLRIKHWAWGNIRTRNPVHLTFPDHPRGQLCKLLSLARASQGHGRWWIVKPFALIITHWMLGDGPGLGHPVQSTEQVYQVILKTPALVWVEATWDAKLIKPLKDQTWSTIESYWSWLEDGPAQSLQIYSVI